MDKGERETLAIVVGGLTVVAGIFIFVIWMSKPTEKQNANAQKYEDMRFEEAKRSSENCLRRGKMVVRSAWDGRIIDCK